MSIMTGATPTLRMSAECPDLPKLAQYVKADCDVAGADQANYRLQLLDNRSGPVQ